MYASAMSLPPSRQGLGKGSSEFTWANNALPVEVVVKRLDPGHMYGLATKRPSGLFPESSFRMADQPEAIVLSVLDGGAG